MTRPGLGILIVGLGVLFAILLSLTIFSFQHVVRSNCNQIQTINRNIEGSIERAKKALPANAYFKSHPDELAKQLKELDRERTAFKPKSCTTLFNPLSNG
jgi:hypothetical protein